MYKYYLITYIETREVRIFRRHISFGEKGWGHTDYYDKVDGWTYICLWSPDVLEYYSRGYIEYPKEISSNEALTYLTMKELTL